MVVAYKDIPGHYGYRVGDDGSVWTKRNNRWGHTWDWRPMSRFKLRSNRKYCRLTVQLGRGTPRRYIHHLVLEAFVGPRPPAHEACHRDANPMNNSLSNLYWGTREQNLSDVRKQKHHYNAKTSPDTVIEIRADRLRGMTHQALADKYGVSATTVHAILSGKRWAHVA